MDFDELAQSANQPDADPFDLLCYIAFNAPLRTRRERAQRLRTEKKDFFDQYGPEARDILNELLDKYAEHGTAQFVIPDVLELPPLNQHGLKASTIARWPNWPSVSGVFNRAIGAPSSSSGCKNSLEICAGRVSPIS